MPPGQPSRPPTTKDSGGTGLNAKLFGLPTWGWVALAGAGGVALLLWLQNRKNAAPAPVQTMDTSNAGDSQIQDLQAELATVESQIRDVQGMPSTPGPAGPTGPAGPPGTVPVAPDDGTVIGGRNVQGYFAAWNAHDPTLHLTWRNFIAMNPQALANIETFHNTNGSDDAFIHNAKYRLR